MNTKDINTQRYSIKMWITLVFTKVSGIKLQIVYVVIHGSFLNNSFTNTRNLLCRGLWTKG